MQLPAWKPSELLERLGGFEGEQKLAQLSAIADGTPLAFPS